MATKNSDRAAFWRQHLVAFKTAGLSRSAYCREHGLKIHQLAYHLTRVGKPATAPAKTPFARVALPKVAASARQHGSRLVFGSGVILELDGGADATWIARVIAAVGGAP